MQALDAAHMDEQDASYHREFLRSPQHVALGVLTLGFGFLSTSLLGLIVGVTAYALGWIYLPDTRFFRGWVDRRRETERQAVAGNELQAFQARRDRLIESLSSVNRAKYAEIIKVCSDIEAANKAGDGEVPPADDPRLRKLDELAWTYLRLLSFQQSIEEFFETERRDDLPGDLKQAAREVSELDAEIAAVRKEKKEPAAARLQLLQSTRDRGEVLRKRIARVEQARENLQLIGSEQERLIQQLKLVRADAVASRNAEKFSLRIDATVEHLGETNRWLAQMDDFKDLVGDMPSANARIGFGQTAGAGAGSGGGEKVAEQLRRKRRAEEEST